MASYVVLCTAVLFACMALASGEQTASPKADAARPDSSIQQAPTKPADPRPNPDASGIYHVGGGVTPPKLIYSVEPAFSEEARKRKINTTCKVQFIVGVDGHVRDAHIVKSCAEKITNTKDHEAALTLDQQAIKTASQYRFEPGKYQGKPVPVELNVVINFEIF